MRTSVYRRRRLSGAALVPLVILFAAVSLRAQSDGSTGADIRAAMVAGDLGVKAIAKRSFSIEAEGEADGSLPSTTFVTSFDGTASVNLPPGRYRVSSDEPLMFEGRSYSWSLAFTVAGDERTVIEISNDNATVAVTATATPKAESTEGDLYARFKSSVFKVLSELGHGSGFLVGDGLLVTNHHVVVGSDYLAVMIDPETKVSARLVVADGVNDVAVLRVNPAVTKSIAALTLAEDNPERPAARVGDRVLAIGSPLATETILTGGLVSKVESGAIYSDVSLNPGNSGGPLLDMEGQVIGINTFRLGSGAGVSGIVRVHIVDTLVDAALATDLSADLPSDERLPVEPERRYPSQALRELAESQEIEPKHYHLEAGKFDVQFLTPVVIANLEVEDAREAAEFRKRRAKKTSEIDDYQVGQDFYEWRRYAGDYRAIVTVQLVPEIRMTTGSIFAVALVGAAAPQRFRFKSDFDRMVLLRNGEEVAPIHPRRLANVVNVKEANASMTDIGYYGSYEFAPDAFAPGASLSVKVWKQGDPVPIVKAISAEQQARVWKDFERYFATE